MTSHLGAADGLMGRPRQAVAYSIAGLLTLTRDRWMLITDFVLATSIPFAVQWMLWSAVYAAGAASRLGTTHVDLMWYYAYTLALGRLNNGHDVILKMSEAIHEGRLELALVKPLPVPVQQFCVFIGESVLYTMPIVLLAIAQALSMNSPQRDHSLVFSLSLLLLIGSQLLCFSMAFALSTAAFRLVRVQFILTVLIAVAAVFGGALLPADFWPDAIAGVMRYNPFRFMAGGVAEFMVSPSITRFMEVAIGITVWTGLFALIGRAGWKAGLERYAGAGG